MEFFLFVKPIYNSEINELIIQIIYRNNKKTLSTKTISNHDNLWFKSTHPDSVFGYFWAFSIQLETFNFKVNWNSSAINSFVHECISRVSSENSHYLIECET